MSCFKSVDRDEETPRQRERRSSHSTDKTLIGFNARALDKVHVTEKISIEVADEEEMEKRLKDLRALIKEAKLDWYVVPSEDEHQSEEIGESDERRSWISGFTGSAGTALIPADETLQALLFVDSRYWIQADKQVSKSWEVRHVGESSGPAKAHVTFKRDRTSLNADVQMPEGFKVGSGRDDVVGGWVSTLVNEIKEGSRVGIDPKLISLVTVQAIESDLDGSETKLVPLASNLIDKIRPTPPRSLDPLVPHPLKFAGNTAASKLALIREALTKRSPHQDWVYILPTLPAIAWLLNIRCPGDIPYCPVAYAYLALTADRVAIFVDKRKINDEVREQFESVDLEVKDYGVDAVGAWVKEAIKDLGQGNDSVKKETLTRVFAPRELSWALSTAVGSTRLRIIPCPVEIAKAVKNPTEIKGFRSAYTRDGRAMVRWLAWLEDKLLNAKRPVGEWAAAQALLRFRKDEEHFAGLAYGDISASGPNGALPHYAPEKGSDRLIDIDATYVIDSGGQYYDGTIDTTRTIFFGKNPPEDVKRAYTRVLQCHIAAATATFPQGMDGDRLIMLGKAALYEDGLDYGHGLGHGIGHYLAVHEYPIYPHGVSFEPGHITSIEPGFYKEGEWGIRTESVYVCQKVQTKYEFGGDRWLGWDRVTQVPIMTNMVDWSLMRKDQIQWLNEHNTAVKETLLPLLQGDEDKQARDWLNRVTKPKRTWPWTGA